MTGIDKERLKDFLNEFASEAPEELAHRFETLIHQFYIYAYGKNYLKKAFPKIVEGEVFYAGPHLLTDADEKRASAYFCYRDAGLSHNDAVQAAVGKLNVSDKSIEAAQTKFRKRREDLNN